MPIEKTPLILSASTFVLILTVYFAFSAVLAARKKERDLISRTERWTEKAKSSSSIKPEEVTSGGGGGLFSFLKTSDKRNKNIDNSIYSNTPLFYQRAGIYNTKAIRSYQMLRYLLLAIPILLLITSHFVYHRPFNGVTLFGALLLGYIGYVLPVMWLKIVAHYRKKELNRTFPEAMDLLMISVEAGMGIDAAITRVSREIHITSRELAKEFKILSLELKTGKTRNSCLKNLAQRTDLPDVNNLVSLLIQADKYGTGVANALKIHAEEMREKRYARLEQLAAKLPVKLVLPLMLFIFPALFVVILGPAAIRILRVFIQG